MYRPGTVSKILWHFTGGPVWDDSRNKQGNELKPTESGYTVLKGIIESGELRVGRYKELVNVILPEKKVLIPGERRFEIRKNVPVTVKSSPVCCVADIPLQHLPYHAKRYGKIAIGFYREAVVRGGFNPVMYTLEDSPLINSIYRGYDAVDDVDPWDSKNTLEGCVENVRDAIAAEDVDIDVDASDVEWELDSIDAGKDQLEKSFGEILAYIKTFDASEFDSIYCEREWRSTSNFSFSRSDVAMVVLPKNGESNYFGRFIEETTLPRTVPITCWEDLLEH